MKKTSARDIAYIGICAALIAVCSWISVPFVVPFTMQTFAIFFALSFLGGSRGTVSIIIYIALGAAGLPVFSGFRGGLGHLIGPTGGYIIGFVASGLMYILLERTHPKNQLLKALELILSMLPYYIFGTIWFYAVYGMGNSISFWGCIIKCVIPFIVPDAVKVFLSSMVSDKLKTVFLRKEKN